MVTVQQSGKLTEPLHLLPLGGSRCLLAVRVPERRDDGGRRGPQRRHNHLLAKAKTGNGNAQWWSRGDHGMEQQAAAGPSPRVQGTAQYSSGCDRADPVHPRVCGEQSLKRCCGGNQGWVTAKRPSIKRSSFSWRALLPSRYSARVSLVSSRCRSSMALRSSRCRSSMVLRSS